MFCHVPSNHVLSAHNVTNLYHVPQLLDQQLITLTIADKLGLTVPIRRPLFDQWISMANKVDNLTQVIKVCIVGKYLPGTDSYLSVVKALEHSAHFVNSKLEILWLDASHLEPGSGNHDKGWSDLTSAHAVLVPGGFGIRGIEGMLLAINYARNNNIPYLGICLGMQLAVIEYARNVLGWKEANSTEFNDKTPHPVIIFMPEGSKTHFGGTMRLGSRQTNILTKNCHAFKLYGASAIHERHRHRYEVNPDLIKDLEKAGLQFVGKDTTSTRMEIIELKKHPYFFAAQYHPEYKSRPARPSPPFRGFLVAAAELRDSISQRRIIKSSQSSPHKT